MTDPGDKKAAGATAWSCLRASNADREHGIEVLKAAFVQGRLAKEDFDVEWARCSRRGPTRIWPWLPPSQPERPQPSRRRPAPGHGPGNRLTTMERWPHAVHGRAFL